MLISFSLVWTVKFVLSILFIFEIAQNYTVIFFEVIKRKHACKINHLLPANKIKKSDAKVSTHYWIVWLYSKSVSCYVFISDKFFNFFWNMLHTKTIEINCLYFYKIKQSFPYKHLYIHQGLSHKLILYFFRQIISWKNY